MIDPTSIARVIAVTALSFGISGSAGSVRSSSANSADPDDRPAIRHDAIETGVLPPPTRRQPPSVWI